jgi:hypothetical protein
MNVIKYDDWVHLARFLDKSSHIHIFKRMRTTSITITTILNRIKDVISNKGQTTKITTKVTFKVIIIITSINHP